MTAHVRRLVMTFVLLLALLAIEVWMSFWLSGPFRPLILVPAIIMIAILAFAFMEIREAPEAAHLFVVASLLWLAILLGLGSLDPLTRVDYPVRAAHPS